MDDELKEEHEIFSLDVKLILVKDNQSNQEIKKTQIPRSFESLILVSQEKFNLTNEILTQDYEFYYIDDEDKLELNNEEDYCHMMEYARQQLEEHSDEFKLKIFLAKKDVDIKKSQTIATSLNNLNNYNNNNEYINTESRMNIEECKNNIDDNYNNHDNISHHSDANFNNNNNHSNSSINKNEFNNSYEVFVDKDKEIKESRENNRYDKDLANKKTNNFNCSNEMINSNKFKLEMKNKEGNINSNSTNKNNLIDKNAVDESRYSDTEQLKIDSPKNSHNNELNANEKSVYSDSNNIIQNYNNVENNIINNKALVNNLEENNIFDNTNTYINKNINDYDFCSEIFYDPKLLQEEENLNKKSQIILKEIEELEKQRQIQANEMKKKEIADKIKMNMKRGNKLNNNNNRNNINLEDTNGINNGSVFRNIDLSNPINNNHIQNNNNVDKKENEVNAISNNSVNKNIINPIHNSNNQISPSNNNMKNFKISYDEENYLGLANLEKIILEDIARIAETRFNEVTKELILTTKETLSQYSAKIKQMTTRKKSVIENNNAQNDNNNNIMSNNSKNVNCNFNSSMNNYNNNKNNINLNNLNNNNIQSNYNNQDYNNKNTNNTKSNTHNNNNEIFNHKKDAVVEDINYCDNIDINKINDDYNDNGYLNNNNNQLNQHIHPSINKNFINLERTEQIQNLENYLDYDLKTIVINNDLKNTSTFIEIGELVLTNKSYFKIDLRNKFSIFTTLNPNDNLNVKLSNEYERIELSPNQSIKVKLFFTFTSMNRSLMKFNNSVLSFCIFDSIYGISTNYIKIPIVVNENHIENNPYNDKVKQIKEILGSDCKVDDDAIIKALKDFKGNENEVINMFFS